VTTGAAAPTAAVVGRIRADPGHTALRRAGRVTAAACLSFYALRYGLEDATTATYALFTAIALGALSDVQGTPASRTRTYLAALAAGAVLITAGTLAAVSTAVAAAGMLVVGFAVAYAGVGGPRVAGVATGLQLFYVLPCFPPFAPDTLDQRLAGLLVGGLLLTAADRLLWPVPAPPPPGERLARAADAISAYAAALRPVLQDPAAGVPPALTAGRAVLDAAGAGLRLANIPTAQRPLGPGVRDRALLAAGTATRVTVARLGVLADLLVEPHRTAHPRTADLVHAAGDAFGRLAHAVRTGRPASLDTSGVDGALDGYLAERARHLAEGVGSPADLRAGLTAATVAEETRLAVLAARGFLGAPPEPAATPPALWFLHAPRTELVRRRLRVHLTPRSVYLQNAVRLALGLAAARVIAGVLDLSHGFWVLLATLSLMRTSAAAGRAVLRSAFAGTVGGALVAGAVLALVGTDTEIFAWALPPVMVLAFAAGPLLGIAAGQAGFTVVVAMLFAQITPTDWQLAEVRLLDVVVGGLVGATIGAAVWPRGGGGEVRRAAAAGLRTGVALVRDTVASLVEAKPVPPPVALDRAAALFDHAYVQFRTEPVDAPEPDWLAVLAVVHRIGNYATVLRARHHGGSPLPRDEATPLATAAAAVAAAYTAAADAIGAGTPLPPGAGAELGRRFDAAGARTVSGGPEAELRLVDAWGWLYGLADDLDRLEKAVGPHPAAPPMTGGGPGATPAAER
jgi:hypothetical protein